MDKYKYIFEVEYLEAGQRHAYSDSYYAYNVTSDRPEDEVRSFCMNVLKKSYPQAEMPNPFAGELLEFAKMTNNNIGLRPFDKERKETYFYRVRYMYTD